jgi:tetratricopeptide (TPR) repeat protein
MKFLRTFCLLACAIPALASAVAAQGGGRLTLSGRVVYEDNTPASMVPVTLRNFTDMGMDQTATDGLGNFSFSVGRGVYYVSVRIPNYTEAQERVEIITSSVTTVQLYLRKVRPKTAAAPASAALPADYMRIPEKARTEYEAGVKEFTRNSNLDASRARLLRAVELHPEFAAAHYWLGMVQLDLAEFEAARGSFEKAIQLNEKLAAAYFPLGSLHMHYRDPDKAVQILTKGLSHLPQYWQGHYELARAYASLGKWKEAEQSAQEALTLKSDNARTHLLLANVFWQLGKDAEAIKAAEKFLSLAPDDPVAPEVRRQVEERKKPQ